ncbi:MAG: hypothetical protein IPH97_04475 [Ignavibacteriales bacterium]|nr:hypothetical protein [Ignavibacteriales bacterium]
MKKLFYVFIGIMLFSIVLYSQDQYNFIRIKGGYGSYSMYDMENIQNFIVSAYKQQNIKASTVDQFPSFWNFELQFSRNLFNSIYITGSMGFSSTGGRVHYRDFSGEVKLDQLVKANSFGLGVEYCFNPAESFKYYTGLHFNLVFSTLEMNDFIRIYNETNNEVTKFESSGVGFEPLGAIEYELEPFFFRLEMGFLLNLNGPYYLQDSNDLILKVSGDEISPDWTGYRFGFSFGIGF